MKKSRLTENQIFSILQAVEKGISQRCLSRIWDRRVDILYVESQIYNQRRPHQALQKLRQLFMQKWLVFVREL